MSRAHVVRILADVHGRGTKVQIDRETWSDSPLAEGGGGKKGATRQREKLLLKRARAADCLARKRKITYAAIVT